MQESDLLICLERSSRPDRASPGSSSARDENSGLSARLSTSYKSFTVRPELKRKACDIPCRWSRSANALTGRVCMITPGRDEAAEASLVAERFASGLTVVRYASWWVGGGIIGIPRPVAALRLLTQPYLKTGLVMTETRFFVSSWVGWAISLLRGLPLLHVEHGGSHPETGNRVLNLVTKAIDHLAGKFLARRGTGVVAVSKAARDFLVHIGVAPDKIVVIPNGLPPHHGDCPCIRMRDGGRPKETMTLGYVGRLTDGKAVDNLIRAFNEIVPTFPEAELWIVGDGPSRRKLERLCHFLGTPQVKFLGSVEHTRPWPPHRKCRRERGSLARLG